MTYKGGSVYRGDFQIGKENGNGTLKFVNADVHERNFAYCKIHGSGTISSAD